MRLILSIVLVALTSRYATAQLEPWHIVHPAREGRYHYIFSAIGSWSESCVVAGIEVDDSMPNFSHKAQLKFWRTDDAGLSWRVQVPKIGPWKEENTLVRSLQMIDSLNIVAVGDSGLLFRTRDGGDTWNWKYLDSGQIHAVHFSNPKEGIIVEWKADRDIATTTDAGEHWNWIQLDSYHPGWYWPWQAQSLGDGSFRAISYGAGPFYYTNDNWRTVDRSRIVFDTSDQYNIVRSFRSLGKDTIIAFGPYYNGKEHRLSMTRSEDDGNHWQPVDLADTLIVNPKLSELGRPFVVIAGNNRNATPRYVGLSTDSGWSWIFQIVTFDSTPPYFSSEASLVEVTPNGVALAIFGTVQADNYVEPTFLARSVLSSKHVQGYERIIFGTFIYPNPSTVSFAIKSVDRSQPVIIYDILGHEVLHGKLDGTGHAQFDVSALPRGVYSVILKHNGIPLSIGKVAVVSK
jgi:hypothetical protein